MNIANLIGFSLDGIFRKKLKTIALIMLFAFSLIIMATVTLFYKIANYSYDSVDKALSEGIKNTGTISINEHISDDKIIEFQRRLYDSRSIKAVGETQINTVGRKNIKELYDIQYGNVGLEYFPDDPKGEDTFFVVSMDYRAIELYNLKLQKGEFTKDILKNEEPYHHVGYMYLGSAFKDIPIGTEYKISERYTMKVAGILKSGAECGTDSITDTSYSNACVLSLDYMAVIIDDYGTIGSSRWLFNAENNCSIDEAVAEVRNIAESMDIGVSVGTLEGMFEEKNRFENMLNDILFELMIIMVLIAVIIQSCIQVVDILGYSHQYGIMYAVGATQRDVSFIIGIESLIRFAVAAGVAIAGEVVLINRTYTEPAMREIAQEIFTSQIVWWMLAAGILMTAVSTVVPLIMIRLNKPVKLINKQGR